MNKILIIDDDDELVAVLAKFLRKEGFEVQTAADGEAGLAAVAQGLPDLVLCDLVMPGLDGYDVLTALREQERLADIPVVFLTGLAEPHQVRQGMNLGADDYLTKPIDSQSLLAAIQARLQRRLSEKQRQERQMQRALQLFAGIVHDLRDPLFVILGYTDLLRQEAAAPAQAQRGGGEESRSDSNHVTAIAAQAKNGKQTKPEARLAKAEGPSQILDRMQQAILRLQAIVTESLFLAKSRLQRLSFDPATLDLRELCARLVEDHEASPRLRLCCPVGAYPIVGDGLRLRQALENLLSNALKYSEDVVELSLCTQAGGYRLEVRDKGIGIPAADQASVFEPFFRASNTAERPGCGLGLSIVKSCVEQHGGHIKFTSRASLGTTFIVDLPLSPPGDASGFGSGEPRGRMAEVAGVTDAGEPPHPQAMEAPATSPSQPGTGAERLRGVIVDDDALVRGLLRDLLENSDEITVLGEAGTVAEARDLVARHVPEVVFLDVNLPDGSGFDLLPALKSPSSVVFVTSAEDYAVHAFDCDAVDYLLKPVSRERLQQALARVRQRLATRTASAGPRGAKGGDSFLVKTLNGRTFVQFTEIKSVIAYGEYSWVYWGKDKGALLRKSLKQWQAELPGEAFVRVHRQAIVNLGFMERVEKLASGRMQIHLRDTADPIQVSLRLAPGLNRKLKVFRK